MAHTKSADPTPEEIAKRCKEIRATWSDATHRERKTIQLPEVPAERFAFPAQSASRMADLRAALNHQFDERLVEPNSALGAPPAYF